MIDAPAITWHPTTNEYRENGKLVARIGASVPSDPNDWKAIVYARNGYRARFFPSAFAAREFLEPYLRAGGHKKLDDDYRVPDDQQGDQHE